MRCLGSLTRSLEMRSCAPLETNAGNFRSTFAMRRYVSECPWGGRLGFRVEWLVFYDLLLILRALGEV